VTRYVTFADPRANDLMLAALADSRMDCEFCATPLTPELPDNLALLQHLDRNAPCERQFEHLLENIRASWTASMSGG